MAYLVHLAPSPEDTNAAITTNSTTTNTELPYQKILDENQVPGFNLSKADDATTANVINLAMIAANSGNSSYSYNDSLINIHNLEVGWVASNTQ